MLFGGWVAQRLDFEYGVNYHGRANGQTLHSIDQSNMTCFRPKEFNE